MRERKCLISEISARAAILRPSCFEREPFRECNREIDLNERVKPPNPDTGQAIRDKVVADFAAPESDKGTLSDTGLRHEHARAAAEYLCTETPPSPRTLRPSAPWDDLRIATGR